jgi:hypothetical protein
MVEKARASVLAAATAAVVGRGYLCAAFLVASFLLCVWIGQAGIEVNFDSER